MTELDGTLSELARLRGGSEPIVSLYLDVRWSDEHQRERVRLFVQEKVRQMLAHYADGSPGRAALERTLGRVQEFVTGLTTQAYEAHRDGVAVFAHEGLGLWRTFFFGRSFENELCADGVPHLLQLARFADDQEPAIVVVPFQDGADLYQVKLGEVTAEEHVRGFVPRGGEKETNAGTAGSPFRRFEREDKNDRHAEEYIRKNRKATIEQVMKLLDETPRAHLVLVGIASTLAAFERDLPERIRDRVIARLPRPRAWESGNGLRRDGVLENAVKAVAEREASKEGEAIDAVVGEALRGGLGVLGPDDVVEALNQGRVHRLVLEECFELTGWRCDNCDAMGANAETAERCPYCGGDLRVLRDLGEAMVARTLAEDGDVEVVAHANKLHSYRGVGAFLRQTSATGLKGATPGARASPRA